MPSIYTNLKKSDRKFIRLEKARIRVQFFDTKKQEVKIISPDAGSLVFENIANKVDVIGKRKPSSKVHLFVGRTPLASTTLLLK